ncbi:MAG: hypothetical protein AABX01_06835 [Candidatus Micrarchaeota archaeon]
MRNQLLVYFILLLSLSGAYSDYSFSAHAKINPDGTAHVTEKTVFLFENQQERKAFEQNMNLGESTIIKWQEMSPNIKHHFRGLISNTKITAKREFSVSFDAGTVIVEYDVGPIFTSEKIGSRRTVYSLTPDSLVFDKTKTGQTSLGNNVELEFVYPKGTELIRAAPVYDGDGNVILWKGPIAGNWEFAYAVEIPLSQEVSEFFYSTYKNATDSLPLILLGGFSLLLLFVLVKFRRN